ncbi:hypothetical protein CY0110_18282 [Crocosphaera chwakensis CCY0110]|uniref:Uncharacterized protein n=1 Tax=Crocosphaera chwakensis CCY0110 TaxID=391612 RepID=A3IIY8_9CHRO|nr:hypothetical protein CY0110_18282 [Crocosphaera chwakensis CCY0110]
MRQTLERIDRSPYPVNLLEFEVN